MYYKELYFQGKTIRFINTNIVVKDVYDFFGQHYIANRVNAYTVSSADIINIRGSVYKETTFELFTFHQVDYLLDQFKFNNVAVEIFRNWLSNFAYVYIEDFIINNIEVNKLEKTINNLKSENAELKAAISKVALDISNQNYSLDILSQVLGLDIDIQTGEQSSVVINELQKDVEKIKSILCEQVGLEYEEGEESIEDKLEAAFKTLKSIYGVFTERAFNLKFLRRYRINLIFRANNRNLSLIEYIATDKDITKLVLEYIPELIKSKNK
jgi:hypothetical protein